MVKGVPNSGGRDQEVHIAKKEEKCKGGGGSSLRA